MNSHNVHKCAGCGFPAEKMCGKCHTVYYCSQDCQRANWSAHKPTCGKDTFRTIRTVITGPTSMVGIDSNAPSYVAEHATANMALVGVIWSDVFECQAAVESMHAKGVRCFINVEITPCGLKDVPKDPSIPVKIKSISVESISRADDVAKSARSSKLAKFCSEYDAKLSIPVVVWCAEPWSCYTFLSVQPWKNGEYLRKK